MNLEDDGICPDCGNGMFPTCGVCNPCPRCAKIDVEKIAKVLYTQMHSTGAAWEEVTGTLRIIYLGEARAVIFYLTDG